MIINYKKTPDGTSFMDITELKNLDASFDYFSKNRLDSSAQQIYYNDILAFLDFCINYANDVFQQTTYSFDHVIPQLFITRIKSPNQYKQYIRYALYAGMLYAKKLRNELKITDVDNLDELTMTLCADYEWLIGQYEFTVKGVNAFVVRHGSRNSLNVMDIKWGANQLMFAELTRSLKDFDYRNTKPYVMFMVRQCLEMLGKNMIGFVSIEDKNGSPIHQFTQIAWTFLHDMEKQKKNLITLPFKASAVHQLNSWANSFVHTSYIYNCYTQYYALEALYYFSKPVQHPIQTYNGLRQSCLYGDYRINDLSLLKAEFEAYVTKQHNGYPVVVKWMEPKDVGAYIISLGNAVTDEKKGCLAALIKCIKEFLINKH